jgi:serine/threonine protein kinase
MLGTNTPELQEISAAGHEQTRRALSSAPANGLSCIDVLRDCFETAVSRPEPGRCVGDCELLDEIGRGGMGVAHRARHDRLNRIVAVKMLAAGANADAADRDRFRREAQTLEEVQLPNVVGIFETGEYDGQPFIVMELVLEGSLAEKIADGPQPPRESAQLVAQLARAVHAVHERGILHCDLKPANVLLSFSRDAESSERSAPCHALRSEDSASRLNEVAVMIADFGLARWMGESDGRVSAGEIVGTPAYMAPEQAAGVTRQLAPAVDVYALGAILYECLTGRPPFEAESAVETIVQLLLQEPLPPSALQTEISAELERICLKCLAKCRGERYSAAAELADDLDRLLGADILCISENTPR